MSLSLNWISTDGGGKAAPGRHYTYRIVVAPDLRVLLSRVPPAGPDGQDSEAELIEQVMLTTIDLGSQPPREGVYHAMALAQQFEDGEPLIGQPEWQEPPALGLSPRPIRSRRCPRTPLGPDSGHQVDGPADCSRCQLLRDNAHWMATGEVDGGERTLGTTGGRFGPGDAATVAGRALHEFPADRETPGRILDAGEQEHLAMTGLALRDHLAGRANGGHQVRQQARDEAAVGGLTGLVNLHRARHALDRKG